MNAAANRFPHAPSKNCSGQSDYARKRRQGGKLGVEIMAGFKGNLIPGFLSVHLPGYRGSRREGSQTSTESMFAFCSIVASNSPSQGFLRITGTCWELLISAGKEKIRLKFLNQPSVMSQRQPRPRRCGCKPSRLTKSSTMNTFFCYTAAVLVVSCNQRANS